MSSVTKKYPTTIAIVITFIILLSAIYLAIGSKKVTAPTVSQPQVINNQTTSSTQATKTPDDILKNALNLYLQKKQVGVDMSNGPCLGKIADDWVLDIAHNPRQPQDNKSENQCEDYRTGKAHHFIELDPDGKLITQH